VPGLREGDPLFCWSSHHHTNWVGRADSNERIWIDCRQPEGCLAGVSGFFSAFGPRVDLSSGCPNPIICYRTIWHRQPVWAASELLLRPWSCF